MPRIVPSRQKPGRPERSPLDGIRTHIWARSVCASAQADPKGLETVLGADGRWNGLWSRYTRGLVNPSPQRVIRINRKLSGTRRYFDSPFWVLLEHGDFTSSELRDCALWIEKPFRDMFVSDPHTGDGIFWRNKTDPYATLTESVRLVGYESYGLDALTSILLVLRESEVLQDPWLYLASLQAWARTAYLKQQHPILKYLPVQLFASVTEAARSIAFPDIDANAYWQRQIEQYSTEKSVTIKELDMIDFLAKCDPISSAAARESENMGQY